MKKEFRDLFYSEKYDEIRKETKVLIQQKPNDAELWYCLFLAENNNYIDIDFDRINNQICLNKAIELAYKRQREEFNSEYNLYKDLSKYPNIRKLVRYAEFGNFNKVIELFELMDDSSIELSEENDIYSNLDYCLCNSSSPAVIDCSLLVVNLLYLKTKKEEYVRILENIMGNSLESKSGLYPYVLSEDIDSLKKKVELLKSLYSSTEDKNSVAKLLTKIEIAINERAFEPVEEMINDVLAQDSKCAKAYWYLLLAKRKSPTIKSLAEKHFKLDDNPYFMNAYKYADDEFKEFLEEVKDLFNTEWKYFDTVKKINKTPLECISVFEELGDYKDCLNKINECKEIIYKKAIKIAETDYSEAIEMLKNIIDYKDSKDLIESYERIKHNDEVEFKKEKSKRIKQQKNLQRKQAVADFFDSIAEFFSGNGKKKSSRFLNVYFFMNIIISVLSGLMIYLTLDAAGLCGMLIPVLENFGWNFDTVVTIYLSIILVSLFFLPKGDGAIYKLFISGFLFTLGFLFPSMGTQLLVWIILIILINVISSIRKKGLDVITLLSSIYFIVSMVLIISQATGLSYLPFIGIAIFALVLGLLENVELSRAISKVYAVWIIINFFILFGSSYYASPYLSFDFSNHLCMDLLGLAMILGTTKNYNNSGIHSFASYVWFIRVGLDIIFVGLTSLNVILGKYNDLYNFMDFYGMYFYMIIPFGITIAMLIFCGCSGEKHREVFGTILGLLLLLVALTFLWKTFSALFGCGVVEGCEKTTVFQGCDDCGQSLGAMVVQLVLMALYFIGVGAFEGLAWTEWN